MSKCQKNKYAAGGKCGSMGSSNEKQNSEINGHLAALLASREKQDALLFSNTPNVPLTQNIGQKAIIIKKPYKSDIDIVLDGDF
jgi:hypothetical protein